jgi:hypothetical protein
MHYNVVIYKYLSFLLVIKVLILYSANLLYYICSMDY